MVSIRREGGAAGSSTPAVNPVPPPKPPSGGIVLPDVPSSPITEIEEAIMLLFGERKIGKTSILSRFKKPFFFMFEPGAKGLSLYKEDMPNWIKFVNWSRAVRESKRYSTYVIDVIDKAYERCMDYVCEQNGMDYPTDKEWGQGWKLVDKEFSKQMDLLVSSGQGVVFVSHVTDKEFATRTGMKYNKLVPTLSNQARKYAASIADIIAYYGYYGDKRYLTLQGSDALEAGCRLKNQFKTPDGRKIHSIPMYDDKDPAFDEIRAYENLMKAWNNEQTDVCIPGQRVTLSELPVKRGKTK